jgi:hypothetical protein
MTFKYMLISCKFTSTYNGGNHILLSTICLKGQVLSGAKFDSLFIFSLFREKISRRLKLHSLNLKFFKA